MMEPAGYVLANTAPQTVIQAAPQAAATSVIVKAKPQAVQTFELTQVTNVDLQTAESKLAALQAAMVQAQAEVLQEQLNFQRKAKERMLEIEMLKKKAALAYEAQIEDLRGDFEATAASIAPQTAVVNTPQATNIYQASFSISVNIIP